MVYWNAEDDKEFKQEAQNLQQKYCDQLGKEKWDVIVSQDWSTLRKKVGFSIRFGSFGSTLFEADGNTEYDDIIEKICDQLVKYLNFQNQDIHFACIFVVMKIFDKRYTAPVFKSKRNTEISAQCVFVDSGARKYTSWNDYLSNNTLQKCIYCYPTAGMYETNSDNKVRVSFGASPACDFVRRVISIFDKVSTVVTLKATGVEIAALFAVPIADPIMAAIALAEISISAYGVIRNTYTFYDRVSHSQSIGLNCTDARSCWLSIFGSSLGFIRGLMIAFMRNATRIGKVKCTARRIAFIVVLTGILKVNKSGIKTANAIIKEVDINTIIKEIDFNTIINENDFNKYRDGLSENARQLFHNHIKELYVSKVFPSISSRDEILGNAKIELLKLLNRLEKNMGYTIPDLYKMIANENVDNRKVRLTPEGFEGMLVVNENLQIHPCKLLEIPFDSQQDIFESTKNYMLGSLTIEEFHRKMEDDCRKYHIIFNSMIEETLRKLCEMYGQNNVQDIVVGKKKLFANATLHEVDRLRVVLKHTMNNNKKCLEKATEFAKLRNCATVKEFIAYVEYFVVVINDKVSTYEGNYQIDLATAKIQPGFTKLVFDEKRGIKRGKKRMEIHRQIALDQFTNETAYDELNQRYIDQKAKIALLNKKYKPGFFTDDDAVYHYMKHNHFDRKLTAEEYFQIAEEVVGNQENQEDSILSQDGCCVIIKYTESKRGVRAIKIRKQKDEGFATVMYDKKVHKKIV